MQIRDRDFKLVAKRESPSKVKTPQPSSIHSVYRLQTFTKTICQGICIITMGVYTKKYDTVVDRLISECSIYPAFDIDTTKVLPNGFKTLKAV